MADLSDIRSETQDAPNTPGSCPSRAWWLCGVRSSSGNPVRHPIGTASAGHQPLRASGVGHRDRRLPLPPSRARRSAWTTCKVRAVVVNFWASWCDPCMLTGESGAVAGRPGGAKKTTASSRINCGLSGPRTCDQACWPSLTSPTSRPDLRSEAARRYGIKGVPETFFINSAGEIAQTVIGPIVNEAQMESYLAEIRP